MHKYIAELHKIQLSCPVAQLVDCLSRTQKVMVSNPNQLSWVLLALSFRVSMFKLYLSFTVFCVVGVAHRKIRRRCMKLV